LQLLFTCFLHLFKSLKKCVQKGSKRDFCEGQNSDIINFALQKQQYKQLCLYHSNITAMVKSSKAVNMTGIEKGGEGKGREGRGGEDAMETV